MTKREKLNIEERANVGGRPTKYKPEYIKHAQLLARGGATQDEIAECLGISRMTVIRWSARHPEFGQAIQAGNDLFNRRVERALAERALGFYADKYVWRTTTQEEREQGAPARVKEATESIYYPPDVTAAIYWTKNRMPERWQEVSKRQVTAQFKSPDEWLADIREGILALQADGHLKTIDLKALPAPKGKNGKGNGA
jgi:transposase